MTADCRTIVYAAAWEGGELQLYRTDCEGHETRPLGLTRAGILAIPKGEEYAVALRRQSLRGYVNAGTLALVRPDGEVVREIMEDVQWADWPAGGGEGAAVVRDVGGMNRLECPPGHTLFETSGWISHPRFSPGGEAIAFLDHPIPADDRGAVAVVGRDGKVFRPSEDWGSLQGLAWSARGDEIWFTASREGNARALYGVTPSGRLRAIIRTEGSLTLYDVSRDGRALLSSDNTRLGIICLLPGETRERDLSWRDWSVIRDITDDGGAILFTEAGQGGGAQYGVFLRRTDGALADFLGPGSALALSPDGRLALAVSRASGSRLVLLPTRGGAAAVELEGGGITHHPWGCWYPDGKRVLFVGYEHGRGTRLYVQDVAGGGPRLVSDEGVSILSPHSISPDGRVAAATTPDHGICLFPLEGGEPRRAAGVQPGDVPVRWSGDGRSLYVFERRRLPASVCRVAPADGRRELLRELSPPDPVGVHEIIRVLLTPDLRAYAYTYSYDLSDLYLAEGLA